VTYGPANTGDEVLASVDVRGKVAVVTGASSGLGREVVRVLVACGADVLGTSRDPKAKIDGARLVRLDLASLDSVRDAALEFLTMTSQIDFLFNNAGVMATPQGRTVEGFELQMGTNHLGHFLLTALLTDAFREHSRIVNTTSLGHVITGMRWEDPHFRQQPYEKWQAYGQSKTANILFTRGLAKRGFLAFAVHPGAIDTGLTRHLEGDELVAMRQASESKAKTVQQGVATLVWAATAREVEAGAYLADCAEATPASHAVDPEEVARLWDWSQEQVGHWFGI
jgi:NAD(P)-dependent dehydrogenase (short-subunit alcohol dehydrogenase family)